MRYVVIMAGGSGTRLWPLSRRGTPKQLLGLFDGSSLLQLAFARARRIVPEDRILVVTGAAYAQVVRRQLPDLVAENVLGEPEGRDSLNAVAWPAAVLASRDPDAVIAQVTADQIIEPVAAFVAAVETAFAIAESDRKALVTLGVVPTEPHTGYGYLHRGVAIDGFPEACAVASFTEKPDAATAASYLASGEYWWNAGMFVFAATTFLEQVRILEPGTHAVVTEIAAHPERLAGLFGSLRRISVDYAIMEPVSRGGGTAHVVAVPLPITWRDVGGFAQLSEVVAADADRTRTIGAGPFVTRNTTDSLIVSTVDGHLVATLGVEELVIVHTPDATLVTTAAQSEQVKALVDAVAATVGPEYV
ncbi:MAG: mannose-1-phosphate guanylyltransferase [Propioniciclava sp.]